MDRDTLAAMELGHLVTMVVVAVGPVQMDGMESMVLTEKVVMAVMGSPIRFPALTWSMPVVAVVELIAVAVRLKGLAGQVVVEMARHRELACKAPMDLVVAVVVAEPA
jgi:hypothetical protein